MGPGWSASIRRPLGSSLKRRRGLRLLLLLTPLFLVACGEEEETHPRSDPRAAYLGNWTDYRRPGDGGLYFLSRFELRGEDLDVFRTLEDAFPRLAKKARLRRPPRQGDLPLAGVNLGDACLLARAYFARLPTVPEWRHAVTGHGGYRFPWGDRFGILRTNTLELGLGRPTPVGTFESGRDPGREDSCYDLFGNVAEWTQDPLFVGPDLQLLDFPVESPEDFYRSMQFGGHYQGLYERGFLGPVLMTFPSFFGDFERLPNHEVFGFATLGFSFLQDLGLPWMGGKTPLPLERFGLRLFDPREESSDLGLRLATDPWTFLARLETAPGRPSAKDLEALRYFLLRFRKEFQAAYEGRVRLRTALGLEVPGPWAREAGRILR